MKKYLILLVASVSLFPACTAPQTSAKATTVECAAIANNGKVWASLYQQRAAEYKALCFQAYNMAKMRLDMAVKHKSKKPFAVVTDVDETLLDNSPYAASQALKNLGYDPKTWKQWTAKAICDTVPGAVAFLKYAASKGVEIFYITNRDTDEQVGTLKNLALYNLPNADKAHLKLKNGTSSKEARRQDVLKTHKIILLCGDNLPDFDTLYDNHPDESTRTATTQKLMKEFGDRYIILPNPTYDDWEDAIFQYKRLSDTARDAIIKAKIKTIPQ